MDYGFVHDGKVYTPDGSTVAPQFNDDRNKQIERAELEAWSARPVRFLAYYKIPEPNAPTPRIYRASYRPNLTEAFVSTWLGTTIGRIVSANVYTHNFGSRMISMSVIGSNGARYFGRASFDWGTCIFLRRCK